MTIENPNDEQIRAGAVSDAELHGVAGGTAQEQQQAEQQRALLFEMLSNIINSMKQSQDTFRNLR